VFGNFLEKKFTQLKEKIVLRFEQKLEEKSADEATPKMLECLGYIIAQNCLELSDIAS
jgi:peroxin-10